MLKVTYPVWKQIKIKNKIAADRRPPRPPSLHSLNIPHSPIPFFAPTTDLLARFSKPLLGRTACQILRPNHLKSPKGV